MHTIVCEWWFGRAESPFWRLFRRAVLNGADPGAMRVLIADDRPMVVDALGLYVREIERDAEVIVESGLDTLGAYLTDGAEPVNLVLLGFEVLARAGLEALDPIRARWPGAPVVLIVERAPPGDLLPALDRGVAGVITTRMSRVGIVKALEMFLAGETYVPSQFLVGRGLGEPRAPYAAAPAPGAGPGAGRRLTARQRQVLALLAGGKTNKQIAARLGTTQANAADHVKRLMKKLDAANRAEAAAKAVRLGLSEPEPT